MEIHARLIMEILGKPKDYVSESLGLLIEKMKNEKNIEIIDNKIHEPVEVKDSKEIFTTFAEIEAKFPAMENFLNALFKYMPSNIEVFSPENFKMNSAEINSLSNLIVGRLHQYDAIVKQAIGERDILANKLREIKSNQIQHNIVVNEGGGRGKKKEKRKKKN